MTTMGCIQVGVCLRVCVMCTFLFLLTISDYPMQEMEKPSQTMLACPVGSLKQELLKSKKNTAIALMHTHIDKSQSGLSVLSVSVLTVAVVVLLLLLSRSALLF